MGAKQKQYKIKGAEQCSTDSRMVGLKFVSQNLVLFLFFFSTPFKDAHYAYPTHNRILHDNSQNGQLFTKFPGLEFLLPMTPPEVISAIDKCI